MTISDDILTFLGLMLTFGGSLFGVIKWVINNHNRINDKIQSHSDELVRQIKHSADANNQALSKVHSRIDDVKDTYVKRVDLDRDLINIVQLLNSLEAAQRDQNKEMNARLDRLIGIFADRSENLK